MEKTSKIDMAVNMLKSNYFHSLRRTIRNDSRIDGKFSYASLASINEYIDNVKEIVCREMSEIFKGYAFHIYTNASAGMDYIVVGDKKQETQKDGVITIIDGKHIIYKAYASVSFYFDAYDIEGCEHRNITCSSSDIEIYFSGLATGCIAGESVVNNGGPLKGYGSMQSYIIRYAYRTYLGLSSDDDIDPEQVSGERIVCRQSLDRMLSK